MSLTHQSPRQFPNLEPLFPPPSTVTVNHPLRTIAATLQLGEFYADTFIATIRLHDTHYDSQAQPLDNCLKGTMTIPGKVRLLSSEGSSGSVVMRPITVDFVFDNLRIGDLRIGDLRIRAGEARECRFIIEVYSVVGGKVGAEAVARKSTRSLRVYSR